MYITRTHAAMQVCLLYTVNICLFLSNGRILCREIWPQKFGGGPHMKGVDKSPAAVYDVDEILPSTREGCFLLQLDYTTNLYLYVFICPIVGAPIEKRLQKEVDFFSNSFFWRYYWGHKNQNWKFWIMCYIFLKIIIISKFISGVWRKFDEIMRLC